jgi:hypothetical protein
MSDPRRLLEETDSELERAMLQSVRSDAMSDQGRRRILAGLGVAGAVVGTSSSAAGAEAAVKAGLLPWLSGLGAKWIAVGVVVGLVPAAGFLAARRSRVESAPTGERGGVATAAAPPSEPRDEAALPDELGALPVVAPPRPASQGTSAAASLSDEVAALQIARRALAGRDPSAALAALDRYARRFPQGRLQTEETVLRIEALMQRGDRASAAALADRFESLHPKSPYGTRIRSLVGNP